MDEPIEVITPATSYTEWLAELRRVILAENPPTICVLAAKNIYDNADWMEIDIPDWLSALANGHPKHWSDLLEHVRGLIRQELHGGNNGNN